MRPSIEQTIEVKQACAEHVSPVRAVLAACVRHLRDQGIDQWDDVYPDLDTVEHDIASGTLYVALEGAHCIGALCLNEEADEAYATVTWGGEEPALIVHRLCVLPSEQGRGVASRLMDVAEAEGARRGYASIRLDAYSGNPRAVGLYTRRGYATAGHVYFPRRTLPFACMEKALPARPARK
ncbi:MAG: GNAT family N-acetyltransferase [Bacteroidota bacterium]